MLSSCPLLCKHKTPPLTHQKRTPRNQHDDVDDDDQNVFVFMFQTTKTPKSRVEWKGGGCCSWLLYKGGGYNILKLSCSKQ